MRTALWMGHLAERSVFQGRPVCDGSTYEEFDKLANEYKAKMQLKERKKYTITWLVESFRPIERLLGPDFGLEPNRGDDDILGAFVWGKVTGLRRGDFQKDVGTDMFDHMVATAWTADRCIIAYTDKKGRELIATIRYDEITGIEAIAGKKKLLHSQNGEMVLYTTFGNVRFTMFTTMTSTDTDFMNNVETFCTYATELVMKYKQAKYEAQQGAAAPQYDQQTPPSQEAAPAAPQAAPEAPQDEVIEALKKFKDLLDAGILTQEEFDAKKKQLLGL